MNIIFKPASEKPDLIKAADEYAKIWHDEGVLIVDTIKSIGGFEKNEEHIEATIIEAMSRSHPLTLRASYDLVTKKATLIHELTHRFCVFNNVGIPETNNGDSNLKSHKQIDLILYDIWVDLYGIDFANHQVKLESSRQEFYQQAWEWALSKNKQQRQKLFKTLRKIGQ